MLNVKLQCLFSQRMVFDDFQINIFILRPTKQIIRLNNRGCAAMIKLKYDDTIVYKIIHFFDN